MIEQDIRRSNSTAESVAAASKAFEILVRRHHRRLLAYAVSIVNDENTARDVVQDAFVIAYRRLDEFDASKDFAAWVRGIVRNRCRESRRARQKLVLVDEGTLHAIEQQHLSWDAQESEHDGCLLRALQSCLAKLPDMLQQAVNLFYLQKLSGADVASRIGVEEATIRKRLQRARQALGDCITHTL